MVLNGTAGQVTDRHTRTAEEKESRRWLHGAEVAADLLDTAAQVTVVADRESDIDDLFAQKPPRTHLLCRSAQDRALVDGGLLSERVADWEERDRTTISVPPRGSRAERQAAVALRFGTVRLRRRQTRAAKGLVESVALWVVDVCEIDPPAGQDPMHWRLLTTHTVTTVAEARQIVAWYRMRWIIEQVFRALKSHGLRIEDLQMEEARGFTKLAVVALIAAVRSMQLVLARDSNSLAWFAWIVARLGGWSGYTSRGYKPPGPKTIHHGLLRLDPILASWHLALRSANVRLP